MEPDEITVNGVEYVKKGDVLRRSYEDKVLNYVRERTKRRVELVTFDEMKYISIELPVGNTEWTNEVFKAVIDTTIEFPDCYVHHSEMRRYSKKVDGYFMLIRLR